MVTISGLQTKQQTATAMYGLVESYYTDIFRAGIMIDGSFVPMFCLPLIALFSILSNIPYSQDTRPVEVVSRPAVSLALGPTVGLDCKKKAVIVAAWCRAHDIPYRFMSVSHRPGGEIHHVFCQAHISGRWKNIDPTYADDTLFSPKKVTACEVL